MKVADSLPLLPGTGGNSESILERQKWKVKACSDCSNSAASCNLQLAQYIAVNVQKIPINRNGLH